MVKIFGNWGRIRNYVTKRIRIPGYNTSVGRDAGKVTTTDNNTFVGYRTGYKNTDGYRNTFLGLGAGYSNVGGYFNNFIGDSAGYACASGHSNNFMGRAAGYHCTNGHSNNFVGHAAGYACTTGESNNFMGHEAGYYCTTGYRNTFIGHQAGHSSTLGYSNVSIGRQAGYYETGNYSLFIDVLPRASQADGRIKALIYGIFNAATANQLLRINGILQLTEIKLGSSQADSGAAANEVWKTCMHATLPDNVLMIGV